MPHAAKLQTEEDWARQPEGGRWYRAFWDPVLQPGVAVGVKALRLARHCYLMLKTQLKCFVFLLWLASLLHRDERKAEDSLGDNRLVQHIILLSVREVGEFEPLYGLLQHHGAQCSAKCRGTDL